YIRATTPCTPPHFFPMPPPPPRSTLFPYTTLFRSQALIAEATKSAKQSAAEAKQGVKRPPTIVKKKDEKGSAAATTTTIAPSLSDRKSTRLNSSHLGISYAVFCLKKKKHKLI